MKPTLPPGPSFLSALHRYQVDPPAFYADCVRRYGPVFTVPSSFGPLVVTGDTEAARTIYSALPDAIDAITPELFGPFIGDQSVVVLSGAPHARARKLVMPPLHGERMRAYAAIMTETARRVVGAQPTGKPFAMLTATQRIALDVMLEAVLGVSVEREPELAAELSEAVLEHVEAMKPAIVFVPALRRRWFWPWACFAKARARLDEVIYRLIDRRRCSPDSGNDVLRLLMDARDEEGNGLTGQELRDQVVTLLFAGHETTAIGLAWSFYHLHRSPADLDTLRTELRASAPEPEALARLPFLEAVCNEALRVHAIVVDVPRTLRRPMELLGHEIPAGVTVSASPVLLHSNPETFPEPEAFRPARFLERKFGPHEFAPFGGGSRRCVGAAFALYEMKVVLGTLLREEQFQLGGYEPERPWRRGFVLAPERGVPMVRLPKA